MWLYAEDMNLNRKDDKKYVDVQKFYLFENKTLKTSFSSPNVLKPYGLHS